MSTTLVPVPSDISLADLARLVANRIRELQPDFPGVDVSTRWLVGTLREHNPDATPRDLWTAAERYLGDWHRGILQQPQESRDSGGIADLVDANRGLSVPRNAPVAQW
jgi:hypothetical protein